MARFPLERTRMRAVFVEKPSERLSMAFVETLPEARIAGSRESMFAAGAAFLSGGESPSPERGFRRSAARGGRAGLSARGLRDLSEDPSIPAPGLVARLSDGSVVLRATMDLVEERLLDHSRGELAKALCAGPEHPRVPRRRGHQRGGATAMTRNGVSYGRITRVSGPVVLADGLGGAGLYDVAEVGEAGPRRRDHPR